jgi:adenosine deaminase
VTSAPELLAAALNWVDLALLEQRFAGAGTPGPAAGKPGPGARWLLESHPLGFDPITARDALALVAAETPLEGLRRLVDTLMVRQEGRVVRCDAPSSRLLREFCSPEVLVAAATALCHGGRFTAPLDAPRAPADRAALFDLLSWSPIIAAPRSGLESLMARGLSDSHVHLAGAIPPASEWVLFLREEARAAPDSIWHEGPWPAAFARARRSLLEICQRATSAGADLAPTLDAIAAALCPESCAHVIRDLVGERALLIWGLSRVLTSPPPHASSDCDALGVDDERGVLEESIKTYIGVRNAFHAVLTHRAGRRGLADFRATLNDHRVSGQVAPQTAERWRVVRALETQLLTLSPGIGPGYGARVPEYDLELRVSVSRGKALQHQIAAWLMALRDVLQSVPRAPFRVGFTVHFTRSGRSSPDSHRELGLDLARLLREAPDLRHFILGIDTAGAELVSPPRDFIETYAAVRAELDRGADAEREHAPDTPRYRLGFTHHAGEDFRDLLTGLRHIDEAANLLSLRPGDRIGHALALFFEPVDFYRQRYFSYPLAIEHLIDLTFAWALLPPGAHVHRENVRLVARRSLELSFNPADLDAMAEILDVGEDAPDNLRRGRRRVGPTSEQDTFNALLDVAGRNWAHRDRVAALRQTPHRLVELRGDLHYCELVSTVRDRVVERFGLAGLAAEVCPTSNVMVGGFYDYAELPYLRAILADLTSSRLPLLVASDDPGVFDTSVRAELEHLAVALRRAGWSSERIAARLAAFQDVSRRYGFFHDETPRGPALARLLRRLTT